MTHNWPAMEGEHGDTVWYSEGAAEYYSILLSHRAGVTTLAQFQEEVNERAAGYYTNPHRALTNRDAAKIFWSDWSAQRIPYGRGFMYLAMVDAQIRAKSKGKRSLDDGVVPMFERKKQGDAPSIEDWLKLVTAEIGPRAKRDYDAMVAGELLIPAKNGFAPCFKPVKYQERQFLQGCDKASLDKDANSCPRGAPTTAYKWERVAGIPDSECKL